MPARNQKSMQRESAPEPSNLLDLLRDGHREIKHLLDEMNDILELPTAVFELYPRIRTALEVHDAGEQFALYGTMREIPALAGLLDDAESAHADVRQMLRFLDGMPFRKQQ